MLVKTRNTEIKALLSKALFPDYYKVQTRKRGTFQGYVQIKKNLFLAAVTNL